MNSQEELLRAAYDGLCQTMIYTQPEAEGLADQAVEKAEETAKVEEREPLSEEEKDRLWKAILESCSG